MSTITTDAAMPDNGPLSALLARATRQAGIGLLLWSRHLSGTGSRDSRASRIRQLSDEQSRQIERERSYRLSIPLH